MSRASGEFIKIGTPVLRSRLRGPLVSAVISSELSEPGDIVVCYDGAWRVAGG